MAAVLLCGGLMTGCSGAGASDPTPAEDGSADKIEVVCATFPAYDWVGQVVGSESGSCEITYLMGSGVDLHSYQPTIEDIAKISDADLFVYVAGESDEWAEDAVAAANNISLRTVSMLEATARAGPRWPSKRPQAP